MSKHPWAVFFLTCLTLAFWSVGARAASLSRSVPFTFSDQSMWGPGQVANTIHSSGALWGGSLSATPFDGVLDLGVLGAYGLRVRLDTGVAFGCELGFSCESGSVDIDFPVNVNLSYPDPGTVAPGDTFTIHTGYSVGDSASIRTRSPKFAADLSVTIDTDLDLYSQIFLGVGLGETHLVDLHMMNPFQLLHVDSSLLGVEFEFSAGRYGVSPMGLDTSGGIDLDQLGVDPAAPFVLRSSGDQRLWWADMGDFQYGLGIRFEGVLYENAQALADAYLNPDLVAAVLAAEREVESFLALIAGGWQQIFSEGDFGPVILDPLDFELLTDMGLRQEFEFRPTLTIDLDLGDGRVLSGPIGSSLEVTMPADGSPFSVAPTIRLDSTLRNTTGIGLYQELNLTLIDEIKVQLDWDAWLNALGLPDIDWRTGPLYEYDGDRQLLFGLSDLLGATSPQGNAWYLGSIAPWAALEIHPDLGSGSPVGGPNSAPEPGTLVLVAAGALGLMTCRRRRSGSRRG